MKYLILAIPMFVITAIVAPTSAAALSCVETGQYIETIIGNEDTYIISATVQETITEPNHTIEVVTITDAHQGYIEKEAFLYHQKDETWGYLCNSGPVGNGKSAVYVVTRNDAGQYWVSQTLEKNGDLAKDMFETIADKEVVGEVVEFSATDRKNQIMTTIKDLFMQITLLLKEYKFWSNQN